ncbi:MAG: YbaK/EbsC family protein [Clostridia bacterium]|nr:YbaK/EbsC family protein [Clostridia bacterium]
MSLIRVKEHLQKYGLDNKIMEFAKSSATVSEAAIAVGCQEQEIAKTLSFLVGESPILIVVAGDCKIDNGKYKAEFSTKAKMIPFEEVENLIGHAVGGVCPFGINDGVTVYLDCSLKRFDFVYPACGSSNSAIKLSIAELENTSGYKKWIDVCKYIELN